jgi:hypothetical protein
MSREQDEAEEKLVQVTLKIPESWVERAEGVGAAMGHIGVTVTKTEALRAAIGEGLDVLHERHVVARGVTYRRLVELVFEERELGRDTTVDVVAIRFNLSSQKARNIALRLSNADVIRETTEGPPISPRRTFRPNHATVAKTIAAMKVAEIEPDEVIPRG